MGPLKELVQEIGRAGRNGCTVEAILYHRVVKKITTTAKAYEENQIMCCRALLFKDFLFSEITQV